MRVDLSGFTKVYISLFQTYNVSEFRNLENECSLVDLFVSVVLCLLTCWTKHTHPDVYWNKGCIPDMLYFTTHVFSKLGWSLLFICMNNYFRFHQKAKFYTMFWTMPQKHLVISLITKESRAQSFIINLIRVPQCAKHQLTTVIGSARKNVALYSTPGCNF